MASIAAILQNNGLTELRIEDYGQLNDSTYIIWFDNDGVHTTTLSSRSWSRAPAFPLKSKHGSLPRTSPFRITTSTVWNGGEAFMPTYWKCSNGTVNVDVPPAANRSRENKNSARKPAGYSPHRHRQPKRLPIKPTSISKPSSTASQRATGNSSDN